MFTRSRKSALALAGAVAGTITAASLAGAVNLGLLSSDSTPTSGNQVQLFEPVDAAATQATTSTTEAPVQVVVQDVYDLPADNSQPPGTAATPPPTAAPTLTQAPAPALVDDGGSYPDDGGSYSDDGYESESHDAAEHESGHDGEFADD